MKSLIFALLFSLPTLAQSLDFSIERSTTLAHEKFELSHSAKKTSIHKTSNWFDPGIDYRLGKFQVTNPALLAPIISELSEIHAELLSVDKNLKSMGSSFNELNSKKSLHAPYFRLNEYRIQADSLLYPRMEKIATKLQMLKLALVDGLKLDKDRTHFVFFKGGKEVKREVFDTRFFCESTRLPSRCLAREWGVLYLE